MQSIERYGVVALVFLVVTVLAVLMWDSGGGDSTGVVKTGKDKQVKEARFLTPEDRKGSRLTEEERLRTDDGSVVALTTEPRALRRDRPRRNETTSKPQSRSRVFEEMDAVAEKVDVTSWAPDVELERPGTSLGTPELTPKKKNPADERRFRRELKELSDKEIYTVKAGDTLGEIAQAQLGTSDRWEEIIETNPGLDPARLTIGMRLKMPPPVPPLSGEIAAGQASSALASQTEPSGSGPDDGRTYTVKAGDTLSEIAQRELGTWKRWKEILAANPGLSEAKLVVGKRLKLPVESTTAGSGPVEAGATRVAEVSGSTELAGNTYRVRSGDSLWGIAQAQLGSGSRWPEIVDLNPGLDPEDMKVGRILALPGATRSVSSRSMNETIVSRDSDGSKKGRVR